MLWFCSQQLTGQQHRVEEFAEEASRISSAMTSTRARSDREREQVSDQDLVKQVFLTLEETPTMWLLDIPGTWVSSESDEAAAVEEANATYAAMQKEMLSSKDKWGARGTQTLSLGFKHKECQAAATSTCSVGCQVSDAKLYDSSIEANKRSLSRQHLSSTDLVKRLTTRHKSASKDAAARRESFNIPSAKGRRSRDMVRC